jgi:hypothetical protein
MFGEAIIRISSGPTSWLLTTFIEPVHDSFQLRPASSDLWAGGKWQG